MQRQNGDPFDDLRLSPAQNESAEIPDEEQEQEQPPAAMPTAIESTKRATKMSTQSQSSLSESESPAQSARQIGSLLDKICDVMLPGGKMPSEISDVITRLKSLNVDDNDPLWLSIIPPLTVAPGIRVQEVRRIEEKAIEHDFEERFGEISYAISKLARDVSKENQKLINDANENFDNVRGAIVADFRRAVDAKNNAVMDALGEISNKLSRAGNGGGGNSGGVNQAAIELAVKNAVAAGFGRFGVGALAIAGIVGVLFGAGLGLWGPISGTMRDNAASLAICEQTRAQAVQEKPGGRR